MRDIRGRLAEARIEDPAHDARLIVEHVTNTTRLDLLRSPDIEVRPGAVRRAIDLAEGRAQGTPVHRLIGFKEFRGLLFELSPQTLEPRHDTEALVGIALNAAGEMQERDGLEILDLGTGTGIVAIALLAELQTATALAIDISPGAVATAIRNAHLNHVGGRFRAVLSDWYETVDGTFDMIVSNPPYIGLDEADALPREVVGHDPHVALFAGSDGLEAYRIIVAGAAERLKPHGRLALEIGHKQRDSVVQLAEEAGLELANEAKDIAGRDRALDFRIR